MLRFYYCVLTTFLPIVITSSIYRFVCHCRFVCVRLYCGITCKSKQFESSPCVKRGVRKSNKNTEIIAWLCRNLSLMCVSSLFIITTVKPCTKLIIKFFVFFFFLRMSRISSFFSDGCIYFVNAATGWNNTLLTCLDDYIGNYLTTTWNSTNKPTGMLIFYQTYCFRGNHHIIIGSSWLMVVGWISTCSLQPCHNRNDADDHDANPHDFCLVCTGVGMFIGGFETWIIELNRQPERLFHHQTNVGNHLYYR